MAEDGSTQGATWPMPKFRFEVDLGEDLKVDFQEVSGMEVEVEMMEYRKSNSAEFSTEKMPGQKKYGNISMKRGVFINEDRFWKWYDEITMNTIKRRTVVIKLLDEKGEPKVIWTLTNAWPSKITSTDLKSEGSEIAVDTLEVCHEKLEIKYA